MTISARSPELMNANDTPLLIVDVQERLLPVIKHSHLIQWNIQRLLHAANALNISTAATEQYPQGLGATVDLGIALPETLEETVMFSCREVGTIFSRWSQAGVRKILICGIETHVCIQQTVLDLLAEGFRLYLATDAMGERHRHDHKIALRRMESSGAILTTTEAALFEWCETSKADAFKIISGLVRQDAPTTG
ncbi:MAG: isochorismatase family protein [Pirellulales bacterium]|nr:isochorismatase family protein [Pirellulales bacterium]